MAYFKHYYSHDGFFTASQIIEDAYVSVTLLDFDIDFQGQTVSDVWAFGSFSNAENGSAKVCHGSGVIISLRAT